MPNPCRSRLAGEKITDAALIQNTSVIVADFRWKASAYSGTVSIIKTCL